MKIGFDFHTDTALFQGVKTYISNVANSLAVVEPNNEYILFNANYDAMSGPTNFPNLIRRSMFTNSGQINLLGGFSIEARKNRLDLFHSNYFKPLFMPCKTVVTIHDILQEVMPEFFPTRHRLLQKFLIPSLSRQASAIITVSNYTKALLVDRLNFNPENVFVTYEAASPIFHMPHEGSTDTTKKYGLHGDYFLFVGRLAPIKNIPFMLRAFSAAKSTKDKSLKFVLVGQRDPLFKESEISDLLERLNLHGSTVFLSGISMQELADLYNNAIALLFISQGEGFGLPVLEAMSCGTPVITSNTTACDEIAGQAALKVDPNSLEEAVDALQRLLEDETLRAELREKGLARAKEFSWHRCAKETLRVYEKCMQGD